jgi:HK97 family phage prohead protease
MQKTYEVEFKALDDDVPGRFRARVSAFGNVDVQGDRVIKGAFENDLKRWRKSGDHIPLIWSHDWANPYAHIGSIDPAKAIETAEGLEVEGEIDLTNAFAAQVHSLMKRRLVKEFSFGYRVLDEKRAADGANDLLELEIMEIGPTLKGANPATELLGVKAELEAAASPTTLTDVLARLDKIEAKLDSYTAVPETTTEPEATTQEPEEATVQEPEEEEADPVLKALEDAIAKVALLPDTKEKA